MSDVRYKIYPSLLDKFQALLDSDIEAESFWNIDSETGEMKQTPDEIASQHEKELLDSINRVPCEPIEAADKGTCFNEIVDCLINGRASSREDLEIDFGVLDQYGAFHPNSCDYNPVGIEVVQAKMNGFTFLFDQKTCEEAERLASKYGNMMVVPRWVALEQDFPIRISLKGIDRLGLLSEISSFISKTLGINMRKLNLSTENGVFEGFIELLVKDKSLLDNMVSGLKSIEGIEDVVRTDI